MLVASVFELYAMLKAGSMDFVGQKQAGSLSGTGSRRTAQGTREMFPGL